MINGRIWSAIGWASRHIPVFLAVTRQAGTSFEQANSHREARMRRTRRNNMHAPDSSNPKQAFADLLNEHHRALFAFVYSLVHNHADAEDVYQQAALTMWRKFDDFQIGTSFSAWAAQVVRNTARDWLKAKRRRAASFSDDFIDAVQSAYVSRSPEHYAAKSDALEACVGKLSSRDRDLLAMFYAPARDVIQIASVTRRSVDAVYQAMSRIRKSLAHCIQRRLAAEG
ncbi:MAG: sigma-70 family RNA polymerase sigma factor [Pirellulales bacterium]|nr:sigma-70 family RNA polymerase sigma factor [Pirellulales bacterium]